MAIQLTEISANREDEKGKYTLNVTQHQRCMNTSSGLTFSTTEVSVNAALLTHLRLVPKYIQEIMLTKQNAQKDTVALTKNMLFVYVCD